MNPSQQQQAIAFLEKALADVKAGKAKGVMAVLMGNGNETAILDAGGAMDTKYALLGLMKHKMMDQMANVAMGPKPSLVRAGMMPKLPGLNGAN